MHRCFDFLPFPRSLKLFNGRLVLQRTRRNEPKLATERYKVFEKINLAKKRHTVKGLQEFENQLQNIVLDLLERQERSGDKPREVARVV